jgi:hypothetical protein
MYSGFAESVPQEQLEGHMHVVLDVIVPIQEALGRLFCAPERQGCKPSTLLHIEVANIQASDAQVTLTMRDASTRKLWLSQVSEDDWRANEQSLHQLLATCARKQPDPHHQ